MIWIDRKAFKDTYSILKKEKELESIYKDLKYFIEKTFNITVFNIILKSIHRSFFDKKIKNSYLNGHNYELICYVGSYDEREKMQNRVNVQMENFPNAYKMVNDKDIQNMILDKFFQLSEKYNYKIRAKKEDIWVDYSYWFSSQYMSLIVSKIQKKLIKDILSKYKKKANIWGIHTGTFGVVVFYDTDSNKKINQQKGISEEIKNIIYTAIKGIDEFDFYKEDYISFDSKENLDKNYQGNLFYYFM